MPVAYATVLVGNAPLLEFELTPFCRTLISSIVVSLSCTLPAVVRSQSGVAARAHANNANASVLPEADAEALELKLFKTSQALLQDPQNPELLLQKGIYLSSLGRLQAAFEVFDGLRQSHPNHPAPYANLASVYARWGRLEEARQMLLKSDNLQGNSFQTQLSLASVNLELALAALNRANQLNPGDTATRQKLQALEKYLADSSQAAFAQAGGAPSAPLTTDADARRRPANMSPPAKARIASTMATKRDRLTLGAPNLGDTPSLLETQAPVQTPVESASLALPAAVDPRKPEILKSVGVWANAWATRSYSDYVALYSVNFRPADGITREAWARRKRVVMEKTNRIQVDLKVNKVKFVGDTAFVNLSQKYRSDRYSDNGNKELQFALEEGSWKILSERTTK